LINLPVLTSYLNQPQQTPLTNSRISSAYIPPKPQCQSQHQPAQTTPALFPTFLQPHHPGLLFLKRLLPLQESTTAEPNALDPIYAPTCVSLNNAVPPISLAASKATGKREKRN
jgi:hypothetical protein